MACYLVLDAESIIKKTGIGVKDGFPLKSATMRAIDFFVYNGHQILDLAGPFAAFEAVAQVLGHPGYELAVLSATGGLVQGSGGLPVTTMEVRAAKHDTLIVVGGDISTMLREAEISAIACFAGRTNRLASVCTGAFLLAEAGFLDGRRATTHWRMASKLQHDYPNVHVDADKIFTVDDGVWTSAGVTAGIDLALAMIDADYGSKVARAVAREMIVYHRRPGGQSQFSSMSQMEPESDRIRLALSFARDHLQEPLPVERLADAAHLSVRQFGRAFRRETGETPARAVERLRAEAARTRLLAGSEPIEQIAQAVGFSDPERMRRAFVKLFGMAPQSVRRSER